MPQMSPYNWLFMNLMFIMIFMMCMILCYFNIVNKPHKLPHTSMSPLSNFTLKW